MEDLRDVPDASFDLAVSYVSLVDVHDLRRVLAEAFRILRPGGRFVVCNLAPMTNPAVFTNPTPPTAAANRRASLRLTPSPSHHFATSPLPSPPTPAIPPNHQLTTSPTRQISSPSSLRALRVLCGKSSSSAFSRSPR